MDEKIDSYDSNVRQLAQVSKVTGGLLKLCKGANKAAKCLHENANDYMVRNYGTWIQNEGGMVSCMVPDVTII
jgi:hypothetical protein